MAVDGDLIDLVAGCGRSAGGGGGSRGRHNVSRHDFRGGVESEKRGEFMKEGGRGKGNKKKGKREREESWRVERCKS